VEWKSPRNHGLVPNGTPRQCGPGWHENGRQRPSLPTRSESWNISYTRMNRSANVGNLDRLFA
jgi:hypothetical protein